MTTEREAIDGDTGRNKAVEVDLLKVKRALRIAADMCSPDNERNKTYQIMFGSMVVDVSNNETMADMLFEAAVELSKYEPDTIVVEHDDGV